MFTKTLLGLAAAGAIALSALAGSSAPAQAGTSVHIGIGVPGYHHYPSYGYKPTRCWLPERHLCGPTYRHRRPVYGYPVYHGGYWAPPAYYYRPAYPPYYHHRRW